MGLPLQRAAHISISWYSPVNNDNRGAHSIMRTSLA